MSDTPRVDSLIWDRQKYEGPLESYSEFARQLERELNAAQKRMNQLEEFVRSCADNFDCDHDSHKWNTKCRACDAQRLIDSKEDKP